MILSRPEIRAAVERGEIKFDPALEERQWGDASIYLRLGFTFVKSISSGIIVPLAKGIQKLPSSLWHEDTACREGRVWEAAVVYS